MLENQGTSISSKSNFDVWIALFLRAKMAEQASPGTLHFYAMKLNNLKTWCLANGLTDIESLTPEIIRAFIIHLEENHNAGGLHAHYRTLRVFLNFYVSEAEPANWANPMRKVKPPKLNQELLDAVTLEDIERLYKAAGSGIQSARDRAILLTLADTGVRASELTGMNFSDADVFSGTLKIEKGKGGKSRQVFIGQRARRALRQYLKIRGNSPGPLFVSRLGGRLSYMGLRQVMRRLSGRAGMPEPQLHAFRRFFALSYLRSGGDLLTLQRLMGHADLSTLSRYVKQTADDLRTAHDLHSPVDRAPF